MGRCVGCRGAKLGGAERWAPGVCGGERGWGGPFGAMWGAEQWGEGEQSVPGGACSVGRCREGSFLSPQPTKRGWECRAAECWAAWPGGGRRAGSCAPRGCSAEAAHPVRG